MHDIKDYVNNNLNTLNSLITTNVIPPLPEDNDFPETQDDASEIEGLGEETE